MGEVLTPDQFQQRYGNLPAAQPGQGAAPGAQPGTQSYYDSYAKPPQTSADPSFGYGTADVPQDLSPSTKRNMGYDFALNGGKGLSAILDRDPSVIARQAYAKQQGDNAFKIQNLREAIGPYRDLIDKFRQVGTEAGPDVLPLAIGPSYTDETQQGARSPVANAISDITNAATGAYHGNYALATGADTSSGAYQAQRAARDPSNPLYQKALGVNTRLQHLKNAVAMAFKSLPGSSGGSGATDQAQGIVSNMVGEALKAPDAEKFFEIIQDAQDSLNVLERKHIAKSSRKSYLPDEWSQPPAGPTPGAPAPAAQPQPLQPGTYNWTPNGLVPHQ
jgi:hypothetical protein